MSQSLHKFVYIFLHLTQREKCMYLCDEQLCANSHCQKMLVVYLHNLQPALCINYKIDSVFILEKKIIYISRCFVSRKQNAHTQHRHGILLLFYAGDCNL